MDAGEDIIDVLYRCRDNSSSPRHRSLGRSRNVSATEEHLGRSEEHLGRSKPQRKSLNRKQQVGGRNPEQPQRRHIEQQTSAPPPPRNYDRDLYYLNRRSLAYRGSGRLSDSVFHRQNFVPANQQSLDEHTRIRRSSGQLQKSAAAKQSRGEFPDDITYHHKSEKNLEIDFDKSRSIKVDVIPKTDVRSKDIEEDLIQMPNGTRQRRTQEKHFERNMPSTETAHLAYSHDGEDRYSVNLTGEKAKQEEEIYTTAGNVCDSVTYNSVQHLIQPSSSNGNNYKSAEHSRWSSKGFNNDVGGDVVALNIVHTEKGVVIRDDGSAGMLGNERTLITRDTRELSTDCLRHKKQNPVIGSSSRQYVRSRNVVSSFGCAFSL